MSLYAANTIAAAGVPYIAGVDNDDGVIGEWRRVRHGGGDHPSEEYGFASQPTPPPDFAVALPPPPTLVRWRSARSAGQPYGAYGWRSAVPTVQRSRSCGDPSRRRQCPAAPPSDDDDFDSIFSDRSPPDFRRRPPEENRVRVLYDASTAAAGAGDNHQVHEDDDGGDQVAFKCRALCICLPKLSRKKKKEKHSSTVATAAVSSTRVSLEKFEWAWPALSSSRVFADDGGGEEEEAPRRSNFYFDLPLELLMGTTTRVDAGHSPPARSVFGAGGERKGVLKKSASRPSSAASSGRQVRFSTSSLPASPCRSSSASPSSAACITPRLLKAREDFYAFLEAQNAP